MLLIPCPWCGLRDEIEYVCGGQADRKWPEHPRELTDQQWGDFLYLRENPRGAYRERWHHLFGCRQWFIVVRDTRTHAIAATF
jgi:sarcosine oxidase subunit delta